MHGLSLPCHSLWGTVPSEAVCPCTIPQPPHAQLSSRLTGQLGLETAGLGAARGGQGREPWGVAGGDGDEPEMFLRPVALASVVRKLSATETNL